MAGYDSQIKIDLPLLPETQNEEIFAAVLPIYNALHIHNQYIDQYVSIDNPPEEEWPTQDPAQNYPIRSIYSKCASPEITAGDIVTWDINGAIRNPGTPPYPFVGMALSDAVEDQYLRIAMPAGVISVEGVQSGTYYIINAHQLAVYSGAFGTFLFAGIGVATDKLFFHPQFVTVPDPGSGG